MENKLNELLAIVEDMDKTTELVEPICDMVSGIEYSVTLMSLIGTVIDSWSVKHGLSPEESVAVFTNLANTREQMLIDGLYDEFYNESRGGDDE